jgi:hypothetical protein
MDCCADPTRILYWSSGIAVVIVVLGAVALRKEFDLWRFIPGTGKLDLKSSWVSNTTVLSAVLVVVIKDVKLVTPALVGANLFFPVLAVGAYVILMGTAFHWKKDAYETPALAYLVAVIVALTAVIGQLYTLYCVVRFASVSHVDSATSKAVAPIFTPLISDVFVSTLIVAGVLLIMYTLMLMSQHLQRVRPGEALASPSQFTFL